VAETIDASTIIYYTNLILWIVVISDNYTVHIIQQTKQSVHRVIGIVLQSVHAFVLVWASSPAYVPCYDN
jgi:hypothetical protein